METNVYNVYNVIRTSDGALIGSFRDHPEHDAQVEAIRRARHFAKDRGGRYVVYRNYQLRVFDTQTLTALTYH
jgi:hypothetical protein